MTKPTTKICTVAHIPEGLERAWLEHLRSFDVAHPGCHFEVLADSPGSTLAEMVELLRLDPALTVMEVFTKETKRGDPDFSALVKRAEQDGFLDKWWEPPEARK